MSIVQHLLNEKFISEFFIRAHLCKNTGKIRQFFGQKYERYTSENTGKAQVFVILSSFCDLVHAESVVDLFAKQLNNARECALNHK